MRFLFVSSNHGTGASEDLWTRAAIALKIAGHEVIATAPWLESDSNNKRVRSITESKITFFDLSRSPFGMRLPKITPQRFWSKNLASTIKAFSPHLIILSNGTLTDSTPLAKFFSEQKHPYVTLDHGILEGNWPNDTETVQLIPLYDAASRTYFVSHATARLLERQLGHSLANATITRNPFLVDYDSALPWPETERLQLASVGRLLPRTKGQDILLQVLGMPKWRNRPVDLNIYGSGPCEQSLKREVQRLNLKSITFHGHVDSIAGIWQNNQALVVSSRQENMPVTVVEAMLCGRVCIATAVGGIPELISHNANGFIAKSATVESLDEAIERAWNARESWQEIGKNAQETIRQLIPRDPVDVFAKELESLAMDSRGK
jgi:glycosyltransferase involved in cell wall biosynthesis